VAVIKARTEFAAALNQVCAEHGVEPTVVLDSIKEAMLAAYRRDFAVEEGYEYEVEIKPENGNLKIFSWKEGHKKAKKDITPPGYGRVAATVAKQVLLQKIREAEKTAILDEFQTRVGTLVNGMILRFDGPNIIVDIGKTEAIMIPQEQVRAEDYKTNQRLTFYIEGIHETYKGKQIIVSRAHKGLVEGLFRREVPEVASGAVRIKEIAREPGNRSKVAVQSTQAGVDPVGSCVGQKGVRVQAVINELNGEKIDIIQYSDDPAKFIAAALSPAEKVEAKLNEKTKTATVSVPDDQLSLAIGRDGQNVRLAGRLTGYKIDIVGAQGKIPAKPEKKEEKEESELEKLGLTSRIISALEKAGITTKAKLKREKDKLSEIKGIGPKAIEQIGKSLK
jgi:N utilization substance protein A